MVYYMVYVMSRRMHFRVTDSAQKENLGILVQYKVKIKLFLGSLGGSVKMN